MMTGQHKYDYVRDDVSMPMLGVRQEISYKHMYICIYVYMYAYTG